jgi:hypothetical protein
MLKIAEAQQQLSATESGNAASPVPAAPLEKPKSTKERVNKAVRDLIAADGFDLSATDDARAGNLGSARWHRRDAQRLRDKADSELTRWSHTTANVRPRGNGGELSPLPEPAHPARRAYLAMKVEEPAGVLQHQASADAMGLLADVDAVTLGLELANDLKAKTRAEKMLAHQAAAFHVTAMRFLEQSNIERGRASSSQSRGGLNQAASVESARMLNAAARASAAMQDALLTFRKLKTGNKQIVQVQHVTVKGGQAVVGQNVRGGGLKPKIARPKLKALPPPKKRRG